MFKKNWFDVLLVLFILGCAIAGAVEGISYRFDRVRRESYKQGYEAGLQESTTAISPKVP